MKTRPVQHLRPALRPRPSVSTPPVQRRMAARTASGLEELGYDPEPTMKLSRALFIVVVMHVIAVGGMYLFQHLKETRTTAAATGTPVTEVPQLNVGATLPTPPVTRTRGGIHMHYVEAGQSLGEIARLYETSVEELVKENGLANPEMLRVGQELRVPERMASTPPPLDIEALPVPTHSAAEEVRSTAGLPSPPVAKPSPPRADPVPAAKEVSGAEAALRQQFLAAKGGSAGTPPGGLTSGNAAPASASNAPEKGRTYVVRQGDNPVAIAREFGVSYSELLRVNGIDDPRRLQIGQTLKIPGE